MANERTGIRITVSLFNVQGQAYGHEDNSTNACEDNIALGNVHAHMDNHSHS